MPLNTKVFAREKSSPLLVVISGPSGAGKDSLLSRLAAAAQPDKYHFLVTATTRPARIGEIDGINHHFVSRKRFQQMINRDELIEWATIYGNLYGTPKQQVHDALSKRMHVLARVDVQGAARLRSLVPEAIFVFVMPPSKQVLRERLISRGLDSRESIERRLAAAEKEIDEARKFDFQLINRTDELDETVAKLIQIIERESKRYPSRKIHL